MSDPDEIPYGEVEWSQNLGPVRRLRWLLSLDGQARYDALHGRHWGLPEWLAQSRSYMRHLPAWRFWPLALAKWPGFARKQRQDERRSALR